MNRYFHNEIYKSWIIISQNLDIKTIPKDHYYISRMYHSEDKKLIRQYTVPGLSGEILLEWLLDMDYREIKNVQELAKFLLLV